MFSVFGAGNGGEQFSQFQARNRRGALEEHTDPPFCPLVSMHVRHILSLEDDLPFRYGIVGKTHDRHQKRSLSRPIGAEEDMGLSLTDMEIDVVQHLFVADIHVQVFDMQHKIIVENMSIAALNAFHVDIIRMQIRYLLLIRWYITTG